MKYDFKGKKRIVVGVMGGGVCSKEECDMAYEVGRLIAERGWILLCGGRGGVMKCVSKGAAEAGGIVVGILPGTEWDEANEYVTVPIPSGIGYARNAINAAASMVVIAIGGASGTLSEMALALNFGRPVIALNSCSFQFAKGQESPQVYEVSSPNEAVELASELIERMYS